MICLKPTQFAMESPFLASGFGRLFSLVAFIAAIHGGVATEYDKITAKYHQTKYSSLISRYEGCSELFVGGGWAGVYSMYRRVLEHPEIRGPKACLFEQSWRIGGRTYSVPVNHDTPFILDVGAYRFSPDMHLPGDLIMNDLKLPTRCYEDGCPSAKEDFPVPFLFNYSAPLRRVVDPETGLPSGYVTPILKMIEILKSLGARVFTETSLIALDVQSDDGSDNFHSVFKLKDKKTGDIEDIENPEVVILNLPRNKLFDVSGVEETLRDPVKNALKCIAFDTPPDMFGNVSFSGDTKLLKAYMYFEDAFWYTTLNKTVGPWPLDNHFGAHPTEDGVMFNIRWHDGPVNCSSLSSSSSPLNERKCNGFLETYYSVSNEKFYSSLAPSSGEPMGEIWRKDGAEETEKLMAAHAALIDILMPLLQSKGVDPDIITPPEGLVVGVWNRPSKKFPLGQGYTAPTKLYYEPGMSGNPDEVCGVPGLSDESYREIVLRPWGSKIPIFLVNNDWVCGNVRYFFGDWAEESLLQAERAMLLLGLQKPEWLDEVYYEAKIASMVAPAPFKAVARSDEATENAGIFSISAGLLLTVVVWKWYKENTSHHHAYTVIPE